MIALLLMLALQAQAIVDVSSIAAASPQVVCQLDLSVLKGEVRRLSWSPDNLYLHVQTIEHALLRDYIVALEDKEISVAFGEPETIVFADARGRIELLDRDKHKKTLPGIKDALLPAWSPDGTTIAFLQRSGRRTLRLMTAALTHPRS